MNEELLAASALLVQSAALLVSHNGFISFLQLPNVKPTKSAVHQQDAKLFQQHWRHIKGIVTQQITTVEQICKHAKTRICISTLI
jgi:hypothetical protein